MLWAIMVTRLYHVSIQSNFYYEKLAHKNMERTESIKPIRGVIYDRNQNLLAMNNMGFAVYVSPHLNKIKLDKVFDTIFSYLPKQDRKKMHKLYRKYNSPYNHKNIKVIDFIHYSDMASIYPSMSLKNNIFIAYGTRPEIIKISPVIHELSNRNISHKTIFSCVHRMKCTI